MTKSIFSSSLALLTLATLASGSASAQGLGYTWGVYVGADNQQYTCPAWVDDAGGNNKANWGDLSVGTITHQLAQPGQTQWEASKAVLKAYRKNQAGQWETTPHLTIDGSIAAGQATGASWTQIVTCKDTGTPKKLFEKGIGAQQMVKLEITITSKFGATTFDSRINDSYVSVVVN